MNAETRFDEPRSLISLYYVAKLSKAGIWFRKRGIATAVIDSGERGGAIMPNSE